MELGALVSACHEASCEDAAAKAYCHYAFGTENSGDEFLADMRHIAVPQRHHVMRQVERRFPHLLHSPWWCLTALRIAAAAAADELEEIKTRPL